MSADEAELYCKHIKLNKVSNSILRETPINLNAEINSCPHLLKGWGGEFLPKITYNHALYKLSKFPSDYFYCLEAVIKNDNLQPFNGMKEL